MRRKASGPAVLLCAALAGAGCGYIGAPLPPALKLPNRITDLAAVQRGDRIIIQFTMSKMTTEAMPIQDPPEVDMRVGVSGPKFDERDWLEHAKRLPVGTRPTYFETSAEPFIGKDVVIAARLLNDRGRNAGWSNFVALPITSTVGRPEHLSARAVAQGVELSWTGSNAPLFRVYRKDLAPVTGLVGDFAPLGDVKTSPYIDATAEFGKPYSYFVQGLERTGSGKEAESEVSDTVSINPKDVFAPAVPSGLHAIIGTRTVELSWDRNVEPDLAGYRVYRAEGDGPMTAVPDKLVAPSYSDHEVKPGGRYRYAVSAYDLNGNESARSTTIEALVP